MFWQDPNQEELDLLMAETKAFMESVFREDYPGTFVSLSGVILLSWTANDPIETLIVNFEAPTMFTVAPSDADVYESMANAEWHYDYLENYVNNMEGQTCWYAIYGLVVSCSVVGNDDSADEGDQRNPDINIPCFSSVATVQVLGKGTIPMADLQVGDHVWSSKHKYEEVYAFGHYSREESGSFLQIQTKDPKGSSSHFAPLEVTGEHLVYVLDHKNPIRADSLSPGDALGQTEETARVVSKISQVKRRGLFNPLTPSGTLVVDGIDASSYISFQESKEYVELQGGLPTMLSHHDFVHVALSPFRLLCTSSLVAAHLICNSYNDHGLPFYVSFGITLIRWANEQCLLLQVLVLSLVFVLCGAFALVEQIFQGRAIVASAALACSLLFSGWKAFAKTKVV
eukprot:Sro123_g059410.2  (399) ;mRNA; f:10460-11656